MLGMLIFPITGYRPHLYVGLRSATTFPYGVCPNVIDILVVSDRASVSCYRPPIQSRKVSVAVLPQF